MMVIVTSPVLGASARQLGFASRPFPYYRSRHFSIKKRSNKCLSMVQSQDEDIDSNALSTTPQFEFEQQQLELISKQIQSDMQDISPSESSVNSETVDDEWAEALQPPINPYNDKRSFRKSNKRRMQMFAYLSQPKVEIAVVGLVLFSCFLVAINTLENIPTELREIIHVIDTFCVYIFAVEFFLRWWSAGQFQLRYLTRPLAAVDAIVVILPLILSGLLPIYDMGAMAGFYPEPKLPGWIVTLSSSSSSALLNLRLLRILKFQRVLTDEKTYMKFEMALGMRKSDVRPYQLQLARVIISIFTLASVSTGLIYAAEHEVNPQISDYFTALYFGLTTLTTGRLFCECVQKDCQTMFYILTTLFFCSWFWRYHTNNTSREVGRNFVNSCGCCNHPCPGSLPCRSVS